ncbi:PREDICTED: uncharacterized protein LOC105460875 [Wasmannia auropunctata]|uniref:uncharacterized protein LOC105460875 n=1 Tax=Wasmannia auropunctata TaxID=64793 RepID=UPI0005EF1C51|nr:PREDICTED: uncharacterized protein LOC105460875 [Wasmannia auropunctata]
MKLEVQKIISINFSLIYGLSVPSFSYILSDRQMRLLQAVADISSKLPQQSYQKLSKLVHAKDVFGFLLQFWLGLIYLMNFKTFDGLLEIFGVYIAMLIFQIDMMYINCVCVLKACFKDINDNLENLRELEMNDIPRCIYHEQRYPFLLMRIKALQKQHLMISNTVQMLNVIFSLHLLAAVVFSLKHIVFYVYYDVIRWQNGMIFFKLDTIYKVHMISSLGYSFIKIILIVWACETGKSQAAEIGTTIHDVLNFTNDVNIKNELNLFSLQILHCENTFYAKGLTVNATLLTKMSD